MYKPPAARYFDFNIELLEPEQCSLVFFKKGYSACSIGSAQSIAWFTESQNGRGWKGPLWVI